MSAHLVFDIETIPNIPLLRKKLGLGADMSEQQVKDAQLAKQAAKPGRPKKDEEEPLPADWIGAALLVPLTIGYLKADKQLNIEELGVYDAPRYRQPESTAAFWEDVDNTNSLTSFNARGFDIPVLELQAFRDRLPLPRWLGRVGLRNWEQPRNRFADTSCDLYDIYANAGAHGMVGGLDAMAKSIGCPGKMGTSGAQVWDMYLAGKLPEIADYCQCDVLDTYWILVRHELQLGHITAQQERELRLAFKRDYDGRTPALTDYCALLEIPDVQDVPVRPPKPGLVLGSLESEL